MNEIFQKSFKVVIVVIRMPLSERGVRLPERVGEDVGQWRFVSH